MSVAHLKSNKSLISACKLWDKVTEKMNDKKYPVPPEFHMTYADHDYKALMCRIDGDKAELTVGSSAGHRAHVDWKKKTLDYYDNREYNNIAVFLMMKSLKIPCKRDLAGVYCKNINTLAKLKGAFKVMAMPTSMDYRQGNCLSNHHKDYCIKAEVKFFLKGPRKEK